jgi:hypothetical protein
MSINQSQNNNQSNIVESEVISLTNDLPTQSNVTPLVNDSGNFTDLNVDNEEKDDLNEDILVKNFFNKFELIKKNTTLEEKIKNNISIKQSYGINESTSAFTILKFLSKNIISNLLEVINRERLLKLNKVKDKKYKSRLTIPIDEKTFFYYWANLIFLENKYSKMNNNLKKNLKKSKVPIGLLFLFFKFYFYYLKTGINKFHTINSCLTPNENEMSSIIKNINDTLFNFFEIKECYMAYDESLFKYAPKRIKKIKWEKEGDPVDIRYIPRKKTKNGIIKKIKKLKKN